VGVARPSVQPMAAGKRTRAGRGDFRSVTSKPDNPGTALEVPARMSQPPPLHRVPPPPPAVDSRLVAPRTDLLTCVRAFYWHDLSASARPALTLAQRLTHIPPNPYGALVWLVEGRAQLLACGGEEVSNELPAVFLAGAHRHPYRSLALPAYRSFGIAFHPAALSLLCGGRAMPADHIAPAQEALPADWRPLLQAVAQAATHTERMALCEAFLALRWAVVSQQQPGWPRLLGQGWQRHAQAACFALFNWTQRHWQRRTRHLTGMSPGEIERLLRLEQALLALRDGRASCAEAAHDHGYVDQSHFTREARAVYQQSPGRLLQQVRAGDADPDWLMRL
jgi:AraC-like DNA-binding protein